MTFQRLYPDSASMSAEEVAAGFVGSERSDRPYVATNFAMTADGRIAVGGRSGPIGNEADKELFHELRARVDAVMVGAGTLRTERYGRLVRDEDRRERRKAAGLEGDPLAVVVSGRLAFEPDIPLLNSDRSRVVILTAAPGEIGETKAQVEYLRAERGEVARGGEPEVPVPELRLEPFLRTLRADYGVRTLLCEGGARLNGTLLREGLVDEYFLSLAPMLAGGTGPTPVEGPDLEPPRDMELLSAMEAGGHLFLRYRVRS